MIRLLLLICFSLITNNTVHFYAFIFKEADVHTATPSLGNAAATWAGWAVTAVAAKFYRSQSDTGRPARPSLTGKAKPASLGTLEFPFNEQSNRFHVCRFSHFFLS